MKRLVATMDPLNLRVMLTLADNISGERLVQTDRGDQRVAATRIASACSPGINFSNVGPGWADKAIQQLRADIKAGALGVGEVRQAVWIAHHQARRLAIEGRRSRDRSAVG